MRIKPEVIDELLKDYKKPEDVLGQNGLLKQLTNQGIAGAGDECGTDAPPGI